MLNHHRIEIIFTGSSRYFQESAATVRHLRQTATNHQNILPEKRVSL